MYMSVGERWAGLEGMVVPGRVFGWVGGWEEFWLIVVVGDSWREVEVCC